MKFIIITLCFTLVCGCSSVTVRTDGLKKDRQPASYEKRFNYYWWGLQGTKKVNVRLVCKAQPVKQIQSIATFSDSVLTLITLGIYSPRTARVWCGEEGKQEAHNAQ